MAAVGSNPELGMTFVAPNNAPDKLPATHPKQWYNGTDKHILCG